MRKYKTLVLNCLFVILTLGFLGPALSAMTNLGHDKCSVSVTASCAVKLENVLLSKYVVVQGDSNTGASPLRSQGHHPDCSLCFHSSCCVFFHTRENTFLAEYYGLYVVLHFSKYNQMISQTDPHQIFQPPKA